MVQPTVLVQADNSWRTLVTTLAVGRVGGFVAVMSGHATELELDLALEDIQPDVVIASPELTGTWSVATKGFATEVSVLRGWSMNAVPGRTKGIERWNGGVAVAMTSGSTGRPKCVVQSEEALRFAGQATIDAVGLRDGRPGRRLRPALVGGCALLRSLPSGDARRHHGVPAALEADGRA